MVCAFTGHRPEHLPWRTDETDARCAALKAVLQREVSALYQRGFSAFLCGMARGCDLYFAEAVLALRDTGELPDANLTAMLPCPSQAALRQKARHGDRAGVALKFHFGGDGRTESSAPANATAAIRRAL